MLQFFPAISGIPTQLSAQIREGVMFLKAGLISVMLENNSHIKKF